MRSSLYLLMADDDPDDHEFFVEVFALLKPNVRVEYVDTGDQVIRRLEACRQEELPVGLLLDYKMPILNAAEVLQHLSGNSDYRDIPKFVWSTSGRQEYIDRCMQNGATDYFIKPNTTIELKNIIEKLLEYLQGGR
jgi:CheY-like chemotaxis protein